MRKRLWLGALCALAVPAVALPIACTGQSSFVIPPVDAGALDARYRAACEAWAAAVCAHEEQCASSEPFPWLSDEQCLARSTLICQVVANDPNVVFDEQRIMDCTYPAQCSAAVRDLPIDCLPPGRSPPGAPCVFHEACSSAECVAIDGPCGTCAAPPRACDCPDGEACTDLGADGGESCQGLVPIGGACTAQDQCEYYCSLADASPGKCVALSAPGEACGDGAGAAPGRQGPPCAGADEYCDATLHCSPVEDSPDGVTCGAPLDGGPFLVCPEYGTCDLASAVCIPPAPDGEICDETQGLGCLPPAECFSNRCVYPLIAYCE